MEHKGIKCVKHSLGIWFAIEQGEVIFTASTFDKLISKLRAR